MIFWVALKVTVTGILWPKEKFCGKKKLSDSETSSEESDSTSDVGQPRVWKKTECQM
jgi:hypothetical protein